MKLIFFGGCFDPPHLGHYKIIEKYYKQCDKLLVIPTLNSPLKDKCTFTTSNQILVMLELLIESFGTGVEIDTFDLYRSGPTYTIDTIRYLYKNYKDFEISMILGQDQLIDIVNWKDYKMIIKLVDVIGLKRPGYVQKKISGLNISLEKKINLNISSKQIRSDIHLNNINNSFLIDSIRGYIIKNNLYK